MELEPGVISSFVKVNGYKTHYVEAGNGEPVILVHGSGHGASGWSGWRQTVPELAKHFHVYAIDVLGYGLTDKPTNITYSNQVLVDHLTGFIDVLCMDKVFLCGSSMGAYTTAKYTCDHPDRVKAMLMVSSGSIAAAMDIQRDPAELKGLGALESYDGTPESMRRWMKVIVHDHSKITDDLIKQRVEYAAMPGHEYVQQSLKEYRHILNKDPVQFQLYSLEHRLPFIKTPMKMIWGAKDNFASPSLSEKLKEKLSNVSFEIFDNSGHQTMNDEHERFNETTIAFFKKAL